MENYPKGPSYTIIYMTNGASQVALVVKNPPASARDVKRCGFDP